MLCSLFLQLSFGTRGVLTSDIQTVHPFARYDWRRALTSSIQIFTGFTCAFFTARQILTIVLGTKIAKDLLTIGSGGFVADLKGTAWQDSISSASCDRTYPASHHTAPELIYRPSRLSCTCLKILASELGAAPVKVPSYLEGFNVERFGVDT